MAIVPNHIISRGRKLHYRRRVPEDVQRLGGFGGKHVYQTALNTSDASEARRKATAISDWFESQCRLIRGQDEPLSTSAPVIPAALSDTYLFDLRDHLIAEALKTDSELQASLKDDADLQEWHEREVSFLAKNYIADVNGNVIHADITDAKYDDRLQKVFAEKASLRTGIFAKKLGLDKDSSDYRRLESVMIETEARIHAAKTSMKPGQYYREGYDPTKLKPDILKVQSTWTILGLANEYKKSEKPEASWAHKVDVAAALFNQYLGKTTAIGEITRTNIKGFIEQLLKTPQNAQKRFQGLTILQAIEANTTHKPRPYPLIAPNTVKTNYLGPLRALFGFAFDQLEIIESDPTLKVMVSGAKKTSGKSTMFEIDELNALFKLPPYVGCRSTRNTLSPGDVKLNDHQFWVPLIILFTGARPSEIAQLAVSDIKLVGANKSFDFLTEYDENDPLDRPYVKSFKTENARRRVPISPALTALGFEDYVRMMASSGQDRLFPDWKASSDPRKLYTSAPWVGRFNGKLVTQITNRKPKPTLYSLRHTFKTHMAINGISPQYQNQIMGHAAQGMDVNYLKSIPVSELRREMEKLNFEGLEITHLKR